MVRNTRPSPRGTRIRNGNELSAALFRAIRSCTVPVLRIELSGPDARRDRSALMAVIPLARRDAGEAFLGAG